MLDNGKGISKGWVTDESAQTQNPYSELRGGSGIAPQNYD